MNYDVDATKLALKNLSKHNHINKDFKDILKGLNEKYVPLYELKWDSKIEGIDTDLSDAAKVSREEHSEHMAKLRMA